jgi:hypothetical protein
MQVLSRGRLLWLAMVLTAMSPQPSQARNCYDGFTGSGCPWKERLPDAELVRLSCQNLAHVRNALYAENGYCFRSAELAALYNPQGCTFRDQAKVPLNPWSARTSPRSGRSNGARDAEGVLGPPSNRDR